MRQPRISSRHKRVIEVDGLRFRDLDGDGVLAPFEDWRLPPRRGAVDLRARLSLDEKAGLMVIGSHFMAGSPMVGDDGAPRLLRDRPAQPAPPPEYPAATGCLREQDASTSTDPITGLALARPRLYSTGATAAIRTRHQRRLIVRDNPAAGDLARWANALQDVAEQTRFGIPVVLASNPRNHMGDAAFGISESAGTFSAWPGELGLAAIGDLDVVASFAHAVRREWRAAGLRKMYGYMADVPSEPRWSRFGGTFGEDPAQVGRIIACLVTGLQGTTLDDGSIALTVKHFPGGGVRTGGHDPHFPWGQTNDYPTAGSLERYHLPPFQAAVGAGVCAVMPYYSRPANTSASQLPERLRAGDAQFEEVAFAYNTAFITGLLRERLGFRGYVNTDSGVLGGMAYGVEGLDARERWAKLVRAGSDLVSDENDPADLIAAVRDGILDERELDRPVTLLLEEMFSLGLFENPYVDPSEAEAAGGDPATRELGDRAQRRSVTLLRNNRQLLPLHPASGRVYAEVFSGTDDAGPATEALRAAVAQRIGSDRMAADPEGADIAIVWVRPRISLFGGDDRPDTPISIALPGRGIDVSRIEEIEAAAPTALLVDFANPWVIADVEPAAAAVAATYGISSANLAAVLFGEDQPQGRLPLTVPASEDAVDKSPRDVPGMFCGPDYAYTDTAGNTYCCGFGLRYGDWARSAPASG